jgi:hypothetical protein
VTVTALSTTAKVAKAGLPERNAGRRQLPWAVRGSHLTKRARFQARCREMRNSVFLEGSSMGIRSPAGRRLRHGVRHAQQHVSAQNLPSTDASLRSWYLRWESRASRVFNHYIGSWKYLSQRKGFISDGSLRCGLRCDSKAKTSLMKAGDVLKATHR